MVATAAHLTDHVLPDLPLRQWVLAVPKRLRYFLQRHPDRQGAALRLFLRAVEQCLRAHSPGSRPAARLGAVAFIHRFGSSLNAHLHFHCVVIDGVFAPAPANDAVFHAASGLDATAITQVQAQVQRRLLRVFVRRGLLPANDAQAMAHWDHGGGFSVDGSVRIAAADRAGRERLLRVRPATVTPASILRIWGGHYNRWRPHMALGPSVPDPPARAVTFNLDSPGIAWARVSLCSLTRCWVGLHHECSLAPAVA